MSEFDAAISRRGGDSYKWTRFARAGRDVIPAWVADMDFASPAPVLAALRARVDHAVFGYAAAPRELDEQVVERLARLYGWQVDPDWFVTLPGVVPGLYLACRCVGEPGDAVLTPTPAYHHFLEAPGYSGRVRIDLPCSRDASGWQLDLDGLAGAISARTRLFLLCNPYNPLGRILSRAELERIASVCLQRGVVICSDEIHCDLLLDPGRAHLPIASLSPEVERGSITLISPSKTFNLPGIGGYALAIIPDAELRGAFTRSAHGVSAHPGALAYHAALAAYRDCEGWLGELLGYLAANRDYLEAGIASTPGLSMAHVEATYLAWIDFGGSGLERPFHALLEAGVALSEGAALGDATHLRLNFGCPRATLEQILQRVRAALPGVA